MATAIRLTLTEAAASIKRLHGADVPIWRLRRVVDMMAGDGSLDIQRVANYRTIDGDDVRKIADELIRHGWMNAGVPHESA